MKMFLVLALTLAANLASAQSHRHSPATQAGQAHRNHHHYSHGHRSLPALSYRHLPSRPAGYWTTHYETVFVPGAFVAALNACGQTQLTFVPAHYESVSRQVWVARGW